MPRTILHIGYPKTATTWFIRHFYPKVKNASVIYYDDISFDMTEGKEYFKVKEEKLQPDKEIKVVMTHIFSGLVNGSWENGRYRNFFIKHLKRLFPDATVILFIRNQLDFIPSLYSSYLKRGCTFRVNKLFNNDPSSKGSNIINYEFLEYSKLIQLYQEHFGNDRVKVFLYEELLEDNRVFLDEFIRLFGFDVGLNDLVFERPNEKIRKGLASFVRHTNMLISRGPQPKNTLMNIPWVYSLVNERIDRLNKCRMWGKKIDSCKFLGDRMTSEIKEYYKGSNNRLIDILNVDSLRKYGYPL